MQVSLEILPLLSKIHSFIHKFCFYSGNFMYAALFLRYKYLKLGGSKLKGAYAYIKSSCFLENLCTRSCKTCFKPLLVHKISKKSLEFMYAASKSACWASRKGRLPRPVAAWAANLSCALFAASGCIWRPIYQVTSLRLLVM